MAEASTMTVPPVLPISSHHQSQSNRQTVSILAVAPTLSQTPSEAGATVYVADTTGKTESASVWRTTADVQLSNGYSQSQIIKTDYPAHVVKIQINPQFDNSRVISTVRLTPDDSTLDDESHLDNTKNEASNDRLASDTRIIERNIVNGKGLDYVRISVVNDVDLELKKANDMVQKDEMNRSCFYYGSFQNAISTMVMSSGQCSPSDTLDSGTCSDLDGTPPPLPKKKNSSTVLLGAATTHKRTGSLTSSGADIDSDDNESNISCDSLNSGELSARVNGHPVNDSGQSVIKDTSREKTIICEESVKRDLKGTAGEVERICLNNHNEEVNKNYDSEDGDKSEVIVNEKSSDGELSELSPSQSGTSSLSTSSSTPRIRSPNPLGNGRQHVSTSPVVEECTYEERKREQDRIQMENAAAEHYANYKRDNGSKYVYEDDRFYKFHVNEFEGDQQEVRNGEEGGEGEEYFAGYKILDREAIRSAKGTVRGVKNRVRAGIATFLQNPSSKNYKQKDAGKVVVYTTSMRVVRKTTIACVKMLRILGTHMVQYEERDLFKSRQFQMELKDRVGCDNVEVPQLFIDGHHVG
ncbi:glutaredoxin domain-containing cysteine-rich protein CG31559, partial [Diachasma alloeum]|uniref:glutaredoxin domain-containing cysteine-rich protein CG31559 n=1 Tax=Diachasma alloeum TaxID=454923 RepID=UPI00073850B1